MKWFTVLAVLLFSGQAHAQMQNPASVYLWHTTFGCPNRSAITQLNVAYINGRPSLMDKIAAQNGCAKLFGGLVGHLVRASGPLAEVEFSGSGTLWVMGNLLAQVPVFKKPLNLKPCCPPGVKYRKIPGMPNAVEVCKGEEC